MKVGIAQIDLAIDHARSLKDKRSVLQSTLSRVRNNYNVSAAETGDLEDSTTAQITLAHVSNGTSTSSDSKLSKIVTEIEGMRGSRITNYSIEVI